jgi:predicted RNA-binding Zn ribbon-like protein
MVVISDMSTSEQPTTPSLLLVGGRLCLDFCNTAEYRDTDHPIEILAHGYPSLVRWSRYVNMITDDQVNAFLALDPSVAPLRAVFNDALALRETLYRLFKSTVDHTAPRPADIATFNRTLQHTLTQRALIPQADHNGLMWQWLNPTAPDFLLYPIILSAEELLTADATALIRLRQCPGCGWLFLDESRNHSRTWCDMRYCGNRAKAKRFHQRRK